jgi:hypothetical protein
MNNRDEREKAYNKQLAHEVAENKDAIAEILFNSKVGQCCGKCKGFKEEDLRNLCPECLWVLEEESEEIFSVSPMIRLLGDVMNSRG